MTTLFEKENNPGYSVAPTIHIYGVVTENEDATARICSYGSIAIMCSQKCTGGAILAAHDTIKVLRDRNVTIISGFHTSIEVESLRLLLRGTAPIVVVVGRALGGMRIPVAWRGPLEAGRLTIVSPFKDKPRRLSEATALVRNRTVVALADRVLFLYAEPGGKTEALCREAVALDKPVFALDLPENGHLWPLGVQPFRL